MNVKVDIQDKGLLQTYAAMKNIPLAKVIRNAARDFVQAAYKATPTARISTKESPYVRIRIADMQVSRHGKTWTRGIYRYIRWDSLDDAARQRLEKHRVRIKKGWSKASWIRLMRILGMTNSKGEMRKERSGRSWRAVNQLATIGLTEKQAVIEDDIHFDARPGEIDRITEAGFALATKRLSADFRKIMKAIQNGERQKL